MSTGSRVSVLALAVAVSLLQTGVGAQQNLALSLFERYLEPLRVNAAIPALSGIIVQDGQVAWAKGLGYRDLEGMHPAAVDTPYPIADLTSTFTAALLGRCVEQGQIRIDLPIGNWAPNAEAPGTTLRQLVRHFSPSSVTGFKYDSSRFALLARPVEDCLDEPFRKALARQILDRFYMIDSVPGYDIATMPLEVRQLFGEQTMARYARTLERMATPYKIDRRGRAVRSDMPPASVDGSHGLISSASDLAKFDAALDAYTIVGPAILAEAWTTSMYNGVATPFGMGWFVQLYEGEKLVWHHGYSADSYSSLILKVPGRRLTLILLANSDGLSAPFSLANGDVTSSIFARTFLRLFI